MTKWMKKQHTSHRVTRSTALLLSLALLLLALALPISAAPASKNWTWDWDNDLLTDGEVTYSRCELPLGYRMRPHTVYVYFNYVDGPFGTHEVESYKRDGGIVWFDYYDSYDDHIFVTDEANDSLEAFFNGEAENFYLYDDVWRCEYSVPGSFIEDLDEADGMSVKTLDVRDDLYEATRYDLFAYDESGTVCFTYGAIYEIDEVFYYVNYQELGNGHFDANGNFSYRSGSVEATVLGGELLTTFSTYLEVLEGSPYKLTYSYEEGSLLVPDPDDYSPFLFFACYILLGFVLPIVPLVFGLVLPRRTKLGKPTYWYAMAIAAGAWIVLALALLILLL